MNIYIPTSPFSYYKSALALALETTSPTASSPLLAAVQATAFAALSITDPHPSITRAARSHYTTALDTTNRALASPSRAAQDSTLISVLLLGLFESILFRGRASPTSWTAHTNGALALLRLRGTAQFASLPGRDLFVQTCSTISSSCLMRAEPIPAAMSALYAQVPPDMADHQAIRLYKLLDQLAELRIAVRHGVGGGIAGIVKLLCDVADMEKAFQQYGLEIPDEWWSVIPPEEVPAHAFRGGAHKFVDHMVARLWITIRTTRLFLNERLWPSCIKLLDANKAAGGKLLDAEVVRDMEGMRDNAYARGQELILDLLAIVPYLWDPKTEKADKNFAARLLLWPLSIAAQS